MGKGKLRKLFTCLLFGACYLLPASVLADQSQLFGLLDKMEASYANVRDYTALFRRQERIDGDWRPEEISFLKFQRPFKVYMRWLSGPPMGREAIYVQGVNQNKVVIHEAQGFSSFFSFLLDPGSRRILKDSRYPFTEIGVGRLIERVSKDARRAWARGELRLVDRGRAKVNGRDVRQIEGILPQNRGTGYGCFRMIVTVDEENGLPIQASIYDWDNVITGEYVYGDLRVNPGLNEMDFDPSNPAYSFPRWRISLSDGE
jgi:outer membrane lipoprotein-sorting protein